MVNVNSFGNSKYLKKEDVEESKVFTVKGVEHQNVALEDQKADYKFVLMFEETDRGLIMNKTNGQLAAKAMGSPETDDWVGQTLELWNDPSVSYAGKMIGGIRIKPTKPDRPPEGELPF